MISPKDVLVLTTSTADNLPVKMYIKPVSAHLVAGTNLFSDFFGGLTDVFGGRSDSYQRQLASLYNDAIDQIKVAAYEIGANCVLGLSIDMDEISGKGKSMFMLTAVGTAVVIDKSTQAQSKAVNGTEKLENVSAERLRLLKRRRQILSAAQDNSLKLDDEVWEFITDNQVDEMFPYLIDKFKETLINEHLYAEPSAKFGRQLGNLLAALPDEKKNALLYETLIATDNDSLAAKLCEIVKELQLFDHDKVLLMLSSEKFNVQKRALNVAVCNKPFYNAGDYDDLNAVINKIESVFILRGSITTKKQLLSSKEKEVWICECGKSNDIDTPHCNSCDKDIKGFKNNEVKPEVAKEHLRQRISLIEEGLA